MVPFFPIVALRCGRRLAGGRLGGFRGSAAHTTVSSVGESEHDAMDSESDATNEPPGEVTKFESREGMVE